MIKIGSIAGSSAGESEDLLLARRCAQGDERATRAVFDAHEPRLRALGRRLLGNAEDAEEVAATTFIRFWKHAGRYRGECSLRSFLTKICLNLIRDAVRGRKPTAAETPGPSSVVNNEDPLMDRIRDGLARLDQADQEILALYYFEDSSYEEIAETLGITYDVLRTRLVRARKRLKSAVGVDDE